MEFNFTVEFTFSLNQEIPKLIAFLNEQETNGKFFSKALQKSPDTDMKKEECGESGVS